MSPCRPELAGGSHSHSCSRSHGQAAAAAPTLSRASRILCSVTSRGSCLSCRGQGGGGNVTGRRWGLGSCRVVQGVSARAWAGEGAGAGEGPARGAVGHKPGCLVPDLAATACEPRPGQAAHEPGQLGAVQRVQPAQGGGGRRAHPDQRQRQPGGGDVHALVLVRPGGALMGGGWRGDACCCRRRCCRRGCPLHGLLGLGGRVEGDLGARLLMLAASGVFARRLPALRRQPVRLVLS
jgi:hypothetical protein